MSQRVHARAACRICLEIKHQVEDDSACVRGDLGRVGQDHVTGFESTLGKYSEESTTFSNIQSKIKVLTDVQNLENPCGSILNLSDSPKVRSLFPTHNHTLKNRVFDVLQKI